MARSLLAGFHRAAKEAERAEARARRESERARVAAQKAEEKARRDQERLEAQLAKADAAERKRLEKERKQAHVEEMMARVDQMNTQLEQTYEAIDTILQATLSVDDFIDLEALRRTATHPPFDGGEHSQPIVQRSIPAPEMILPPEPSGILSVLKKGKYNKAVAAAKKDYKARTIRYERDREKAESEHAQQEAARQEALAKLKRQYDLECAERESQIARFNSELDQLIANLGYGTDEAIQQYIGLVMANSVYPPEFPVTHTFEFDAANAELAMTVMVPAPGDLPSIKAYRYNKSADEIVSSNLSQKACKDRYAGAVHGCALRTFHEVFEADRRSLIRSINLVVGTETIQPATGLEEFVPFVACATTRDVFMPLNLANVMPAATLEHLGASSSKNPFGLVAAKTGGVRKT